MKMFVRLIFISVIFFYSFSTYLFAQNKIKLGLLVPITGEFSEIGQSIIKSTLLAINKIDNPLKNAPHTHVELTANKWTHKYDRETAAYPSATLKTYKYWPPVARVDNVYGDKNLFCSCPSLDDYKETAA